MKHQKKYDLFRTLLVGEGRKIKLRQNADIARYQSAAYSFNLSEARDRGENISITRNTAENCIFIKKTQWPLNTT